MIMKFYMILKKLNIKYLNYSLIFSMMALVLIGCEKLFKDDNENTLPLKTLKDYNQAMAGLYNRFYNGVMGDHYTLMISIGNGDDLNIGAHTDCKVNLSSDIYDLESPCSGYFGPSEGYDGPYKLLYQAIGSANDIISKAGNIKKLDPTYKKIIGEVYFIRAYSYFRLVRMYGQVPLVSNPDVEFNLPKPSFTEIYNFIIDDLNQAMGLLPNSNNEARIRFETPHRGTAKALLAEVYLTMGGYPVNDNSKYADAARVAGEVIDSASYFGFGLMPDLADLWNGQYERNPESEFSFYEGVPQKFNDNPFYSYAVAPDLFNSFPRDYRKEISFQTRMDSIKNITWDSIAHKIVYDESIVQVNSITYNDLMRYKKFYTRFNIPDSILSKHDSIAIFDVDRNIATTIYAGEVIYMLRYAQTLLTYAEAKARSGSMDASAYEAINQVRRRANKVDLFTSSKYDLQPGLTSQQLADSVVQERTWELCGEPEGRWFDMLRLGLANNLVQIKYHQCIMVYATGMDRTTFFLPIPEEDVAINPNLN
jgi:starch-binding outer membrane protein, SusD/RagB family